MLSPTQPMSQLTSRHVLLAVLLALASLLQPLTPVAAAPSPSSPRGDSVRPRIMEQAASKLVDRAPATGVAPATTTATALTPTSAPQVRRQVFGYVNAGNLTDPSVGYTTWNLSDLTTVAFFGIHVNSDGSLAAASSDKGRQVWESTVQPAFLATMHDAGVKVVLSIIQQSQSTLCSSLSPSSEQTTVGQTIAELKGADGVNIDYEGTQASCSSAAGDTMSARLDNLARLFRQQLPAAQNNLTIATYASAAQGGGFFDIPGLAPSVNAFFVMAYDMDGGYSGGNWQYSPVSCSSYCFSPTAPLTSYFWNDTRAVQSYLSVVPPSQVVLGVPYYGYTACVASLSSPRPGPNATAYPASSAGWQAPTYIDSVSTSGYSGVSNWAESRDVHDSAGAEPYSTWQSSTYNCWRESYWDDTTSLGRKYDLVNQYNLLGAGLFALDYGGGSSELWYDLSSHFNCPSAPSLGNTWQPLTGTVTDVAPGAACTAYATGTDSVGGGHGVYYWNQAQWTWVGGGGVEIALGPSGPWVVNSSNQIYAWNGSGWTLVPGYGRDIAANQAGDVWLVGTNPANGGYGIWRWENGRWDQPFGGGGVRIAVDSAGNPWVVNSSQQIWHHTGSGWIQAPGSAIDIGAGGYGTVWVIGTNQVSGGNGIWSWNGSGWTPVDGGATSISVSPSGMPWVVNNQGTVFERV